MANDLTVNPAAIDTAAASLVGGGPWHISKIRWVGFSDTHALVLAKATDGSNPWLKHTAVAAVDGKSYEVTFPDGFRIRDFACTTLGGGVVYVYRQHA